MPVTPTRDRVIPESDVRPLRRPNWIKVRAPSGETYEWLQGLMRKKELRTAAKRRRKAVNHPTPKGLKRRAQLAKKR